jgi:hypothetical protein
MVDSKINKTLAANIVQAMLDAKLSQGRVAEACGVTVQAVNGWRKTGKIARKHFPTLSRLTGWSATELIEGRTKTLQTQDIICSELEDPPYKYGDNIAKIIASTFDEHNNALVKGEITVSAIAYSAAIRILSEGGLGKPVTARMICASEEECELLEIYRKTKPIGQKSILDAAKGIQMGLPIANNIEMFPIKIPMRLKTT